MAKEKTLTEEIMEERQKFEERMAAKVEAAAGKVRERLSDARKAVRDLENELAELTGKKGKRTRAEGERKCTVCGETGHNARRHTKEEIAAAKRKKNAA